MGKSTAACLQMSASPPPSPPSSSPHPTAPLPLLATRTAFASLAAALTTARPRRAARPLPLRRPRRRLPQNPSLVATLLLLGQSKRATPDARLRTDDIKVLSFSTGRVAVAAQALEEAHKADDADDVDEGEDAAAIAAAAAEGGLTPLEGPAGDGPGASAGDGAGKAEVVVGKGPEPQQGGPGEGKAKPKVAPAAPLMGRKALIDWGLLGWAPHLIDTVMNTSDRCTQVPPPPPLPTVPLLISYYPAFFEFGGVELPVFRCRLFPIRPAFSVHPSRAAASSPGP
jgi:hypothetical protein